LGRSFTACKAIGNQSRHVVTLECCEWQNSAVATRRKWFFAPSQAVNDLPKLSRRDAAKNGPSSYDIALTGFSA
ncbi:MAG TPA: hypothetical protein PLQ88_21475, partial [Blastocatellia bacterium]|nr:hypothetical protein [Blastocatellia bacterium]HMY74403.1 hypothetical protein [Blastocatellia bacterium]